MTLDVLINFVLIKKSVVVTCNSRISFVLTQMEDHIWERNGTKHSTTLSESISSISINNKAWFYIHNMGWI